MADLFAQGQAVLEKNIKLYNDAVDQQLFEAMANGEQASEEEIQEAQALEFGELEGRNERVNEIFNTARESVVAAPDFIF